MNPVAPAPPVIDAVRLRLRPLAVADAEQLHLAYGDPEAMRFWDFPATGSVGETARCIERSRGVSPEWHAAWGLELKHGARQLVGMVNYHRREPWNRRLEVGYILARPFWHQGLMQEAMRAFLDYCVERLDAHRVEAMIEPGNVGSIRLAERLGFRRESGLLRDRLLVGGEFRSVFLYALLAPERLGAKSG